MDEIRLSANERKELMDLYAEVEAMDLDREVVSEPLLQLFSAGGRLSCNKDVNRHVWLPHIRFSEEDFEHLQRMNLVKKGTDAFGTGANRVYNAVTTQEGNRYGRLIYLSRVQDHELDLQRICERYTPKLLHTTALNGIQNLDRATFMQRETEPFRYPVRTDRSETSDKAKKAARKYQLRRFSSVMPVDEEMVCAGILDLDPTVQSESINLLDDLRAVKLVEKIPAFSSKGEQFGHYYSFPKELISYLGIDLNQMILSNEISRLNDWVMVLMGAYNRDMTKRDFSEMVEKLQIPIEHVKLNLSALNGKGITSQFNPSNRPSAPPFLVKDHEKLNEEFIEFLAEIGKELTTDVQ